MTVIACLNTLFILKKYSSINHCASVVIDDVEEDIF